MSAPSVPAQAGPSEQPTPVLEVRDLEVAYRTEGVLRPVLHGISFSIAPGERLAVVGESGSGKSTTAAALLGLLPGSGRVTGGSITFKGEDITRPGRDRLLRLRGREVGLVPQDPMSNLNPVLRVGRQISETLVAHGVATGAAAKQRAVELMEEAGIPDAARRAKQYPHEFSGGMRQRVLIAIALAAEPELLIADEPTSALDVTVQRQILDHLDTLTAARQAALLLITHDLGLAAERCDTVVVMSDGRVVERGPARTVLAAPEHDYTRRLIAAAPTGLSGPAGSTSATPPQPSGLRRLIGRLAGRPAPSAPASASGAVTGEPAGETVLSVRDLVKVYRIRGQREPLRAVDGVSFDVTAGTTTAIVGESGSGKSTTARLVLGLEEATSGHIDLAGRRLAGADRATRRVIRRNMQPVFQDPYGSLDPTKTVERLIDEPLRIFGIGDPDGRRQTVGGLLDQVALPRSLAQRRPSELSGGQRQRVAIARALALSPRLVICDEAVSALDVLVQHQVLELLQELQRNLDLSYLFISHDLAVVHDIASDVLVMRRGEVVEHGPTRRVFADPQHPYTVALLDAVPGRTL